MDFRRALSKEASARNNALKDAEKILKADRRTSGSTIKRELAANDRGVIVDGVYAVSQGFSGAGSFQEPFADLKMPGRRGARRP